MEYQTLAEMEMENEEATEEARRENRKRAREYRQKLIETDPYARAAAEGVMASRNYIREHGPREGRFVYESRRDYHASNERGTCLWCGEKLRLYPVTTFSCPSTIGRVGGYGDGYFCGLRCAYDFAVVMAEAGRRCKPVEE